MAFSDLLFTPDQQRRLCAFPNQPWRWGNIIATRNSLFDIESPSVTKIGHVKAAMQSASRMRTEVSAIATNVIFVMSFHSNRFESREFQDSVIWVQTIRRKKFIQNPLMA